MPFYQFRGAFWRQNKVAQSGFRTVIVCHFALFTILGSQKHPRITKNHQNFSEFHLNVGEFHLRISGIWHFWVDFWCHFTTSPYVSQTSPRRLPDDSQATPRRLPDGSQTAPRRLPDDSQTTGRRTWNRRCRRHRSQQGT